MKKNRPTLSIIINAGNEEGIISQALKSALFADEIVFVAANSTDHTVDIVKKIAPHAKIIKIFDSYGQNFDKWHNLGLKNATQDWVFHLDADERITPPLHREIISTIKNPQSDYYAVPRANYFLGKRVHYGNSYPDYVKRLFPRLKIKKWLGKIHEEPIITGNIGYLKNDLLHFTHRNLRSMLQKTILWTDSSSGSLVALFKNDFHQILATSYQPTDVARRNCRLDISHF